MATFTPSEYSGVVEDYDEYSLLRSARQALEEAVAAAELKYADLADSASRMSMFEAARDAAAEELADLKVQLAEATSEEDSAVKGLVPVAVGAGAAALVFVLVLGAVAVSAFGGD